MGQPKTGPRRADQELSPTSRRLWTELEMTVREFRPVVTNGWLDAEDSFHWNPKSGYVISTVRRAACDTRGGARVRRGGDSARRAGARRGEEVSRGAHREGGGARLARPGYSRGVRRRGDGHPLVHHRHRGTVAGRRGYRERHRQSRIRVEHDPEVRRRVDEGGVAPPNRQRPIGVL